MQSTLLIHAFRGAPAWLVIVISAGLLGACAATGPADEWWLNGRAPAQFEADRASCKSIAADSINSEKVETAGGGLARGGGMAALGGVMVALEWAQSQAVFSRCMQSRGYVQRR